ncbi:hypothetical protein OESDEN_08430 [Oesophagostomum dentatum]|uniref:Uncharacterized protein n=1 Tax=Oesophagostomum dentatum TaxID=61180 RepID=A0A0B1T6F3_OESDE|nr:hypothetical protein OESDEN_08430 [Oesophagostomum dentatum]
MLLRSRTNQYSFLLRCYLSTKLGKSPEPKFSQSAAFQAILYIFVQGRKRGAGVAQPAYKLDYYNSDEFAKKKLLSICGSLTVFILYFGYLREPSDLDEIWNTPPHILTANLERKMLRDQIKEAETKGKDTTLLKAQLDYVDVKEQALQIQFQAKGGKRAS